MRFARANLRRELGVALIVKFLLLLGLWFLIFRWTERPAVKTDAEQLFGSAPTAQLLKGGDQ